MRVAYQDCFDLIEPLLAKAQDGTVEVTVSGSNNTLNETTQAAYYRVLNMAKQRGIPGFHTVSDDYWYVVTYTDGTFIYYAKGFVGTGSENKLYI